MHGVLVIDKPAGVSSAMAVERVRRDLRIDRAGHGGTLDPLATGVLPICVGAGTKLAQFLLAEDKASNPACYAMCVISEGAKLCGDEDAGC